jgi:hypothetical protein
MSAATPRFHTNAFAVRAQAFAEDWPEVVFWIFIGEIGFGLRSIGSSSLRSQPGRYIRFRRDTAGRLVEVHDAVADDGFEVGRVTVWAPGARLALAWREPDWPEGASTDLDIRFEPVFAGTLMCVAHSGFERVGRGAPRIAGEYRAAWTATLVHVARRASANLAG